MEARPCKHCKNPVAYNAKRCPQCGGKKPYPLAPGEYALGCLAIIVLLVGVGNWSRFNAVGSSDDARANNPAKVTPEIDANRERIRQLESEWNRLREENRAMSASSVNDARAFAENDKRIVEIIKEIDKLKIKN